MQEIYRKGIHEKSNINIWNKINNEIKVMS
jgi:hypothetical protein